jgi:hypothetical protein
MNVIWGEAFPKRNAGSIAKALSKSKNHLIAYNNLSGCLVLLHGSSRYGRNILSEKEYL